MKRVLKNLVGLLFISLLACSHAPHGKVVAMDPMLEEGNGKSKIAAEPEPVATYTQAAKENFSVPSAKDDAAIFYFSLAQAYSLDNETSKAIEAYRATLVYDPKSAFVHSRLAAELIKEGNFSEARSHCESAIQLDAKYIDSYLLLAGIQVSAKEYNAALSTYRRALAIDPNNRDALLYYGVTLAEAGKTKDAVATLEKLVKLKDDEESNIDQSVGYFYLAKVQQQRNDLNGAIQSLEMSLKKRPGFAKAALYEAELYNAKQEPKKAKKVLEIAFAENHQSELAEHLAEIYLSTGDFKGAVIYLETLVEEDPANEGVRLKLALVYWQLGWLSKARMALIGIHDRYPANNEVNFFLGEIEFERKDMESALAFYAQVNPEYAKFNLVISRVVGIYREEKNFAEAEKYLLTTLQKRPDMVALYPMLGAIYEDQNKLKQVLAVLEQGQRLFPNDENILYYLGYVHDRMGNRTQGLFFMEKLLETNPDNANALNFVGYSFLQSGKDMAKAENYLRRAFALKPQDAYVLDSYGWLLHKTGKQKEAMVYLEKAFNLRSNEPVIAEHLADVYVALHLSEKALLVYQKALGLESSEEDLKGRVELKMENIRNAMASGSSMGRIPASEP